MKLNKNECKVIAIYIILIIPFLGVAYFNKNVNFIKILRAISVLIFTILIFNKKNKIKINKMTLLLLIFIVYNFVIALLNSTFSVGILYSLYFQLIILIFLQQSLSKSDYRFLEALKIAYSLMMIINIPSLFMQLSISNYDRLFFLGGKNAIVQFALPTIFYNYICSYLKHNKLTKFSKLMIIISLISPLICGSTTGFFVALLMTLSILLKNNKIINLKMLYVIYFVMLFLMFNTEVLESITFVRDIIYNKFHKDLTFTGRTYIWDFSYELIKNNIFGYGRGNMLIYLNFERFNECHNIFLQFLLDGGIPSLLIFILMVYYCNKEKKSNKKNFYNNNKVLEFSKFALYSFLFLGLMESINYNINLWIILFIIDYLKSDENMVLEQ